jgi:ATP-dependent DNA ligase
VDLRGEGRRLANARVQSDHTRRFAGIAAAVSKLSVRKLVLDGEVAIFDARLRSRFDWLREPDPDAIAAPPMFMAFDLQHQDGRCTSAALDWKGSLLAATSCCLSDDSPGMASRRGPRSSPLL